MIDVKRYICILGVFFGACFSGYTQEDTIQLKLWQAIDLAKQNNLSVKATHIGVEKARQDRQTALSKLFPNIALNAQYSYTLQKQKVYFGSESEGSNPFSAMMPSDGIEMGQKHNLTTMLNASVPLFAPQLWASLALDKLSVEHALEQMRSSQEALKNEVRKAFVAALLAEESLRVLRRSYDNMGENYQTIKEKFAQGVVAEYDVIRMESQLNNLKPSLIQSEQQVHLAKMKLLVLMNLAPTQVLVLREQLQNYEVLLESDMLTSSDSLDLQDNQVLRNFDLNLRQILEGIKVKRAEFLPTLALSFNYSQNFASDFLKFGNERRWTPHALVALSMNMPLYTGSSTRRGITSLKLQVEQLKLQRQHTLQQLSLQVRNAQNARSYACEQYQASRDALYSAQKGLKIAEMRYKVGASTLLELNDAELALRQAELNKAQAIYNYLLALYALEELQGK